MYFLLLSIHLSKITITSVGFRLKIEGKEYGMYFSSL